MRSKVVYIGDFSPSKMDAQTQLVLGNSRIFCELGMDVILICNDNDMIKDGEAFYHGSIDGFECYCLHFSKSFKGLLKSTEMFLLVKSIFGKLHMEEIAYVFCYGSLGFANQLLMLSDWCKNNHVPIISNCVDLPDVNHGNMAQRVVKKIDRAIRYYAMRKYMDGMIAVSRYIQEVFAQKRNYPITVIPPLKDTKELEKYVFAPRDKIKKIVYVGVPFPTDGRKVDESAYKDRIDLFIDQLCAATCKDWRLDIYGITEDQYSCVVTRHQPLLARYREQIAFHGRIEHEKALCIVADADYTVVYRLKNRMTMAGFSTKYVESISCGTPVLMTDTSEYVKYVEKGVPSIILDLQDEMHRKKALECALMKTPQEMMEMKEKCRASHAFDYRQYIAQMREFLAQVDSQSAKR